MKQKGLLYMPRPKNNLSSEEIKEKRRRYQQEWRNKNREKYRAQVRAGVAKFRKSKPERYYEIQRKYDLENPEKRTVKQKRYQQKFPKKLLAQGLVNQAIAKGELVRQPCACCQNPKSEAHHCDYSKPLEVLWFCKKHHMAWHKVFIAIGGE